MMCQQSFKTMISSSSSPQPHQLPTSALTCFIMTGSPRIPILLYLTQCLVRLTTKTDCHNDDERAGFCVFVTKITTMTTASTMKNTMHTSWPSDGSDIQNPPHQTSDSTITTCVVQYWNNSQYTYHMLLLPHRNSCWWYGLYYAPIVSELLFSMVIVTNILIVNNITPTFRNTHYVQTFLGLVAIWIMVFAPFMPSNAILWTIGWFWCTKEVGDDSGLPPSSARLQWSTCLIITPLTSSPLLKMTSSRLTPRRLKKHF